MMILSLEKIFAFECLKKFVVCLPIPNLDSKEMRKKKTNLKQAVQQQQ